MPSGKHVRLLRDVFLSSSLGLSLRSDFCLSESQTQTSWSIIRTVWRLRFHIKTGSKANFDQKILM